MHRWLHPPPSVVNVVDMGHGAMRLYPPPTSPPADPLVSIHDQLLRAARESPEALLARLNTTAAGLRDPQPQLLFRKVEDQRRVRFRLTAIGCDPVI